MHHHRLIEYCYQLLLFMAIKNQQIALINYCSSQEWSRVMLSQMDKISKPLYFSNHMQNESSNIVIFITKMLHNDWL